jgi:hypothetical protein
MAPAETEAGGLVCEPDAGLKPKLPNAPPAVGGEEAWVLFLALAGKEEAVGEAKSCSSSSTTDCMPLWPGDAAGEVPPKGLLPGKVFSAIPD